MCGDQRRLAALKTLQHHHNPTHSHTHVKARTNYYYLCALRTPMKFKFTVVRNAQHVASDAIPMETDKMKNESDLSIVAAVNFHLIARSSSASDLWVHFPILSLSSAWFCLSSELVRAHEPHARIQRAPMRITVNRDEDKMQINSDSDSVLD